MTQPQMNQPFNGDPVEEDAKTLERKFGEEAATYAENRSEAAELRGAEDDAEHWREVAEDIEQGSEEE